jgi:transitional endoplasmic reticulum ATPase
MTGSNKLRNKVMPIQDLEIDEEVKSLLLQWMLRILVPLGGYKKFIARHGGFADDDVAAFIGLEKWIDNDDFNSKRDKIRKELFAKYYDIEAKQEGFSVPTALEKNIHMLSDLIGLDDVDKKILGFSILLLSIISIYDGLRVNLNDD